MRYYCVSTPPVDTFDFVSLFLCFLVTGVCINRVELSDKIFLKVWTIARGSGHNVKVAPTLGCSELQSRKVDWSAMHLFL